MKEQHAWAALSAATVVGGTDAPHGDFAFLSDPLSLLTSAEREQLREDLNDLAKLRRDSEAESATLRLA